MKKLFLIGLLIGCMFSMEYRVVEASKAAGRWVTSDKVWDDARLLPNESFSWSGGRNNDGFASGQGVLQWYLDGKPTHGYLFMPLE